MLLQVHQLTACEYVNGSEALFPEVVKLLASSDLVIKKLCSWYILRHSSQGELLLLAVNTLLKDCCSQPHGAGVSAAHTGCTSQAGP